MKLCSDNCQFECNSGKYLSFAKKYQLAISPVCIILTGQNFVCGIRLKTSLHVMAVTTPPHGKIKHLLFRFNISDLDDDLRVSMLVVRWQPQFANIAQTLVGPLTEGNNIVY